MEMKHFVRILSCACVGLLCSLVVNAQEPADLGNYRITKIGEPFQITPTTPLPEGQWFIMGRSQNLKDTYGDGYVYENILSGSTPEEKTDLILNASCTASASNTGAGRKPNNWNIDVTDTDAAHFHVNTWSGGPFDGVGTTPFAEYWWYNKESLLPNATLSHDQITDLTPGLYELSIVARMYSENEEGTLTSANPVGISFYAQGTEKVSVNLNTGTPSGDGRGYYGKYTVTVEVGTARTLDFGFEVNGATCNWLAFKDVTFYKLPIENKTSSVANAACDQGTNSTLTSWSKTGAGTLSIQNNNARYDLGDTWTGNAGDLYNGGGVFDNEVTVSHDQVTGLENGRYQISVDARVATEAYDGVFNGYYYGSSAGEDGNLTIANYQDVLGSIGATSANDFDVLYQLPDGTLADLYTSGGGWHAADESFINWGEGAAFYLQALEWYSDDLGYGNGTTKIEGQYGKKYNFGRYYAISGATTYTAHLVYKHKTNGKAALLTLTLCYGNSLEFNYQVNSPIGSSYEGKYVVVDKEAILASIGAADMSDVKMYYELPNGDRIEGTLSNTDGWHAADGTFTGWGNNSVYYMQEFHEKNPEGNAYESGQCFIVGGFPGATNVPATYSGKIIYKNTSTDAEAVINIRLVYTGILAKFYAGDQQIDLSTGNQYNGTGYNGYSGTYTLNVSVVENTLDFGFDISNAHWLSFKNVKLYYLGELNPIRMSNNERPTLGTTASNDNVRKYLIRFAKVSGGVAGTENRPIYSVQFGTGNYMGLPYEEGGTVEATTSAGNYLIYMGFGYRNGKWETSEDGMFFNSTVDGSAWGYLLQADGLGNPLHTYLSGGSASTWDYDPSESIYYGDRLFTLYPVDLSELSPTTPDVALPTLSTKESPVFYYIKNVGLDDDYASYSEITGSEAGGYATIGRTEANRTGNSIWWFSNASDEAGYQYFPAKSKKVRIHNAMMHDVTYNPDSVQENMTMLSAPRGVSRTGSLYYLFPATSDGKNGVSIARSEYSTTKDAWYADGGAVYNEIGQHSQLGVELAYNANANTLWQFIEVPASTAWTMIAETKREDMHEGAYFSPTTKTLDDIFGKDEYKAANINAGNFFSQLEKLSAELYKAATDSKLPTLAPETGGRFYFKNYAVPNHYFTYRSGLDIVEQQKPSAPEVWELLPFSDPTLIVRLDDQPHYNNFTPWYYERLPHKPLQRFWVRNRATGDFLTHAYRDASDPDNASVNYTDKSSLEQLAPGVWKMYKMVGGKRVWIGQSDQLGTVNSLDREDADLWYLDVVTNPRTGVRTGVLRTLFNFDWPWDNMEYEEDGTEIRFGDAVAGYNYPVVQWDMYGHQLKGWGVTATDHTRAFSEWVIYDIDTDLPEVGVNYTFKNKYAKKYAYWDGTSDGGSLKLTESVEDLDDIGDKKPNRGVWTLVDLATPASDHWRIANRWAVETNQTKQKLNPLKLEYTVAEHNGSTFYLPTSNVDPKGIAISLNADLATSNCLLSYVDKSGVTQGKSENDRAVWGIDKVDRMYDDVIYDLNKMLGNLHGGDSYFYVDKEAVKGYNSQIEAWNTYVENTRTNSLTDSQRNNEYPTYKTIKDLVNGKIGDDKFVMPVKKTGSGNRYLIRNKETKRYLTNLGQLTTVDEDNLSYYSFWNLALEETESGSKYLYTLTNEGAANVMDAQGDSRNKNYKYMTFDDTAGDNGFKMSDAEMKLHFRPDGEGFARLHYYRKGDKNMDDDLVLYGPTWGDRVVQSKDWRNNNVYWEVVPVGDMFSAAEEKALVQNTIQDIEGYSGGPISLTDVTSTVVGNGTGTYDLANLPAAVTGATGSAAGLGTLMEHIWNMDDMFLLQWKPGFPVYVENVFRPSRNARLTAGTGEEAWTTTETKNDDEASQTFEFETATDGKVYLWNKSETKYVKASTADDEAVASTTTDADKAQLTVKEILPGMYSMMDVAGRYLSIDDDGNVEWTAQCGYGSLWRIKCNDYLQPNIAQVPSESILWPSEYVNTFSSNYDTRIDKTTGVRAYYAKNSANDGLSIGERGDEKQIQILFTEAKNDDDHYYLQGGQPYMLVKTGGKISNDELKVWSQHKGEYEDGTLSGKNLLSLLAEDTEIDETNQRNIFELNYIAPGTVIGQIVGHEVTAFGIGFYPVKKGRTLKKGSVVVNSEMLGNWVKELRKAYNTGSVKGEAWAPSLQIILEDEDGTTTALDELMAAEEMTEGPVYDLSGRKVSDSFRDVTRKGMYIVNGQKVMKK